MKYSIEFISSVTTETPVGACKPLYIRMCSQVDSIPVFKLYLDIIKLNAVSLYINLQPLMDW